MLGALIHLGASTTYISESLAGLDIIPDDVTLRFGKGVRHSIEGVKVDVVDASGHPVDRVISHDENSTDHSDSTHHHDHHHEHSHHHASYGSIVAALKESRLPEPVVARSVKIFHAIAVGEAHVHGVAVEDVHFHEVGAVDSIVDIVGVSLALESLNVDRVYCDSVAVGGGGFIRSQHGMIPIPAPATLEILSGLSIHRSDIQKELTTPTGAGIVKALSHGALPEGRFVVDKTGFGVGTRDLPQRPNLLRVTLGSIEPVEEEMPVYTRDSVHKLETNVDDMNPEAWTLVSERLFEAGALDVWLTPVSMKKGRPATMLSLLVPTDLSGRLEEVVLRETTSIGVRRTTVHRRKLKRTERVVDTPSGQYRVKVIVTPEGELVRPEADEIARYAQEMGVPFQKAERELLAAVKGA